MDPFIGEIKLFAGTYAPVGWLLCNGQTLPITQFQALYAVIGPRYGGDGRTTFAVPNLAGRVPMDFGAGPGLRPHQIGETGGSKTTGLTTGQLPSHSHLAGAATTVSSDSGVGAIWAGPLRGVGMYATGASSMPMSPAAVGPNGNSAPHNNMQPYLPLNFIIAYQGIFPPRT